MGKNLPDVRRRRVEHFSDDLLDRLTRLALDLLEAARRKYVLSDQTIGEDVNGIAFQPRVEFTRRPIGRRIRARMTGVTGLLHFDERRAFAASRALNRFRHSFGDLVDIL